MDRTLPKLRTMKFYRQHLIEKLVFKLFLQILANIGLKSCRDVLQNSFNNSTFRKEISGPC